MYLALIVLPLLGSIVSGFFGRKVGVSGSQLITCSSIFVTTVLSLVAFYEVGLNNSPVSIELFRWIDSESLNVLWAFHFDSLTVSMLIPVLIVSCLVHIYSIGYMSHDPHNQRFFSYLSLFTFMMIILVTANSFLLMFVGWEGVGICSYLLVSFWFTRIAANQSSMSAFLTNRVGDCFLTIGMFALLWSFGNIDYSTIFSLAPYVSENTVTIIGICLLIGAMAKSSQIGLHVWLPLAMEGPTPVSALIHAATMVTAGVYLLMRASPLIEYSSTVLLLCMWIGAITTVFSSLIGLFQQDIKKVIAYSTMSQLGMMVIAIGLSSYNIALFHLVNHAFYKGLLFLGAGSVIHAWADNQDFRKYGGLKAFLPLTYSVMLIASLSLVAFPFMTGFYSKDLILESAYGHFSFSSIVIYILATVGAMFTTLYSFKVLYLTFLTNPNGPIINYKKAHESDIFMSMPLIILALFSIFFGYLTKDIFIGLGTSFFSDNSLFIHPKHEIFLDTEFAVASVFKLLPLILTIAISLTSMLLSEFLPYGLIYFKFSRLGYNVFSFFNQRFLIELFYNKYVTGITFKLGGHTTKVLDKGSVELIGPFGLEKILLNASRNIATLDTGVITSYALYILIGLVFYMLMPYLHLINSNILLIIVFALISSLSKVNSYSPDKISINLPLKSGFLGNCVPTRILQYIAKNKLNLAISLVVACSITIPTSVFIALLGLPLYFRVPVLSLTAVMGYYMAQECLNKLCNRYLLLFYFTMPWVSLLIVTTCGSEIKLLVLLIVNVPVIFWDCMSNIWIETLDVGKIKMGGPISPKHGAGIQIPLTCSMEENGSGETPSSSAGKGKGRAAVVSPDSSSEESDPRSLAKEDKLLPILHHYLFGWGPNDEGPQKARPWPDTDTGTEAQSEAAKAAAYYARQDMAKRVVDGKDPLLITLAPYTRTGSNSNSGAIVARILELDYEKYMATYNTARRGYTNPRIRITLLSGDVERFLYAFHCDKHPEKLRGANGTLSHVHNSKTLISEVRNLR